MAILFRDLAMPEIVFSEQNKKLTENRTEMKGAELMSGKRTDYLRSGVDVGEENRLFDVG